MSGHSVLDQPGKGQDWAMVDRRPAQRRGPDDLHDWRTCYAELAAADRRSSLTPEDLEQWAVAAFLLGHDDEVAVLRERAHDEYLKQQRPTEAVRCGFWLGFHLQNRGELARAGGWLERIRRLVPSDEGPDGRLTGMLLLPDAVARMSTGDPATALPLFDRAARIAGGCGDLDIFVLACLGRGRCLEMLGQPIESVAVLDEVMVHVTGGAVAPQVVGLAYCSMIDLCMRRFDLRRAQEWTQALTGWCDDQSGLVPYRGSCLVRRAEILQLRGAWAEAAAQAQQACERLRESGDPGGAAHYRLAEIERMRGNFTAAEREYRSAAECGVEVQPGYALLRAAQGHPAAAAAGLERALAEDPASPARPRVQAARIEIALTAGDLATARTAADDLTGLAAEPAAPYLKALAAHCGGAVLLAEGDPGAAIPLLRRAWAWWQQVDAPYEAARTRLLVGAACRGLGDADAERMEIDAARVSLENLGAVVDLASIARGSAAGGPAHRLSPRELEVLRLLATGATNRIIAHRLLLSEKTVARHVSNVFAKLGVTNRAAATAYAYQHHLS
jgi:DNA-binding CsgD family transcriptional regulator